MTTYLGTPVKSAFASKINWAQIVAAVVTCVTAVVGALNLDAAQAATITAAVAAVGQLVTIVLRTFYTTAVVQNSVPKQGG